MTDSAASPNVMCDGCGSSIAEFVVHEDALQWNSLFLSPCPAVVLACKDIICEGEENRFRVGTYFCDDLHGSTFYVVLVLVCAASWDGFLV